MRELMQSARQVEENPKLPAATCEPISGCGAMGRQFRSGHVLGLRRWTASPVGEAFASIWHHAPAGRWTFYVSEPLFWAGRAAPILGPAGNRRTG